LKKSIATYLSPRYISIILTIVALALRFLALMHRELSGDEIFQFNNIVGPFKPIWLHGDYGDHSSFPGDYVLTYPFVTMFAMNKWGLAIPHILATVFSFFFLYRICQRFFTTVWGYMIAFAVVAFNANLIYHSFEFRPYAVLPTLALANLHLTYVVLKEYRTLTTTQKIWLGVFFFISFNFHAYGALMFLMPLFFNMFMITESQGRPLWHQPTLKYFLIVIFCAMPVWLWYAGSNHFGVAPNPDFYTPKDPFLYIPHPIKDLIGFSKGILGNLIGQKSMYFLLLGCVFSFLIGHPQRKQQILFLALLIILPLGSIMGVDILSRYWFLQRQFVWIMPLFAIFLGWCWDSVLHFVGIK